MKKILLALFFLLPTLFFAQTVRPGKYWVEFTDKNNNPYCTCRPAEFLSARALQRRAAAGIPVVENDLPPNPQYIKGVLEKGAVFHHTSRWLNALTVVADSAKAAQIQTLPFVKNVVYVGKHLGPRNPPLRPVKSRKPVEKYEHPRDPNNPFGYAFSQNDLLNATLLHGAGHRGRDIWVAVMDGGFTSVDTLPFFDSLALQNRLFQGRDFVERDHSVFESSGHGTSVLSVMGSNLPGYFIGTAPEATYILLKTEDTGGEFPIEECNWIAGAEWADSVGVDMINASLGYTTFNDPKLSHRFATLDGKTAIGSRGAAIAATKGMIICNSAGNSGDEPWKHIGVPSDAPGILCVGAVDAAGGRATFSSVGPSADGRIKPDLMAPGNEVVVAGYSGTNLGISSGTSLASPMLTGAIASLWSAYPDKTAVEIQAALFQSADQINAPDSERGYGLPNLGAAWMLLGELHTMRRGRQGGGVHLFSSDPTGGELRFVIPDADFSGKKFELRNIFGQKMATGPVEYQRNELSTLVFTGLNNLPPGTYTAVLYGEKSAQRVTGLVWK
jgi:serine protease AprX